MTKTRPLANLSRRERQIMELLYRQGHATASEVLAGLADAPSYSAVRALLKVLETKGHVRHVVEGTRYVYQPTLPRHRAGLPALETVMNTFCDGSTEQAVAALLDISPELSDQELDRLSQLIEQAREEGR